VPSVRTPGRQEPAVFVRYPLRSPPAALSHMRQVVAERRACGFAESQPTGDDSAP
jgi:hypothetical protein